MQQEIIARFSLLPETPLEKTGSACFSWQFIWHTFQFSLECLGGASSMLYGLSFSSSFNASFSKDMTIWSMTSFFLFFSLEDPFFSSSTLFRIMPRIHCMAPGLPSISGGIFVFTSFDSDFNILIVASSCLICLTLDLTCCLWALSFATIHVPSGNLAKFANVVWLEAVPCSSLTFACHHFLFLSSFLHTSHIMPDVSLSWCLLFVPPLLASNTMAHNVRIRVMSEV